MRSILIGLILIAITGCTQSEEKQFNEFVKQDVAKLTLRNGAGVTYSTTDKELINRFISIMDSTTYSETKNPSISGSSRLIFFGADGKQIAMLTLVGDYFYLNGDSTYYKTFPNQKLHSFYQDFIRDANLMK